MQLNDRLTPIVTKADVVAYIQIHNLDFIPEVAPLFLSVIRMPLLLLIKRQLGLVDVFQVKNLSSYLAGLTERQCVASH